MKFCQVNVFSKRTLGNPLGCFLNPTMNTQELQQLANWMNLSETIFIFPSNVAHYKLRIFTPTIELPFAGHPLVGSALAAKEFGLISNESHFQVETLAGILQLKLVDGQYFVETPIAKEIQLKTSLNDFKALLPDHEIRNGLIVDNGPKWLLIQAIGDDIHNIKFNLGLLKSLLMNNDALGLTLYQVLDKPSDKYESCSVISRSLFIDNEIVEDPITGSANACIGYHLKKFGLLEKVGNQYFAFQGGCVGRRGVVSVTVGDRVWVGGDAEIILTGNYCL
ncbi:hypothetical protein HDV02_005052 [Globomyces sp. JEL0801]|nr:hypothetical protein HDV02_005052 [Globomyces sp. JEL0801]